MKTSLKILKVLSLMLVLAFALPIISDFIFTGQLPELLDTFGGITGLSFAGFAPIIVDNTSKRNIIDIKTDRNNIGAEMRNMQEKSRKEGRDLNDSEKRLWDVLSSQIDDLNKELLEAEEKEFREVEQVKKQLNISTPDLHDKDYFIDMRSGERINVLSYGDPVSKRSEDFDKYSLGRSIQALITGDWSKAQKEKRALDTSPSSAGMIVPSQWWGTIIDQVRSESVIHKAGCKFVTMNNETMLLARVTSDPVVIVKAQNAPFPEGTLSFEPFSLNAKTIGSLIVVSRELAADAVNLVDQITSILIKTIRLKLDQLALFGNGTTEPLGLANVLGIESIDLQNNAELNYDHLIQLWTKLANNNCNPSSYFTSNRDFANMISERVAGGYLMPPTLLQNKINPSSALPINLGTSENQSIALAGDFNKMLIGIRNGALLEISTEGDYFTKHQIGIKITMRADVGLENPNQFGKIVNIAAPGQS